MRLKKFAATSALAIAALGISAGTAYADPAPAADAAPGIHWDAKIEGASVVLKTDLGSLATRDGQFQVLDDHGALVTAFPLAFQQDGLAHPMAAQIDGNTATFTPNMDPAAATPAPVLHDVASQADQDAAWSAASSQFGIATGMGTLIGTLIGGVGGCVLGAVLGTPVLLPGWVGGCLMGAGVGIPLGAAAGLVLTGGVAAVAIGIGLFNRLSAPDAAN
ncbi:hypothetical protein D7D52_31710 [Nocardia yunnanensis]|uniref:DUF8020 domain-containing protein n=1 Tax=Nocardia yunnanensis TaxID=2382165 RepID=A0A386ZJM0_9NOCA|nr:hypothetical protein [Nocardia yunnanensis]AYF77626.1 hypothetical protein D7D52_31710 [Nocardia yunnanensis]